MINYHYSYFVGALAFLIVWLLCFIFSKNYKAHMIWGTVIAAPLAISSLLFIPQYWTPPSLFDLDLRFRIGIEDVLWSGAVGGIASIIGELTLREHLSRMRSLRHKRHYGPFIFLLVLFLVLELWHPGKTIYNTIISLACCALLVACIRRNLITLMLASSAIFTFLYLSLFLFLLTLFPEFIKRYYNLLNLLGLYILGIPVEELMFAAAFGAVWGVAYEYLQGYRVSTVGRFGLMEIQGREWSM